MSENYRESHLHKGEDYDEIFELRPREAALWGLEKSVLRRVLTERFPGVRPDHLDFACGTGRILGELRPFVHDSVGVDVSPNMLAVAETRAPDSTKVLGDITRQQLFEGRSFDLITAFRFFPNAEAELRREAIQALRELLAKDGAIVINNHLNSSSSLRLLQAAARRPRGHSMTAADVEQLCSWGRLQVASSYGIGLLPVGSGKRRIERAIIRVDQRIHTSQTLASLCEDRIYVLTPDSKP